MFEAFAPGDWVRYRGDVLGQVVRRHRSDDDLYTIRHLAAGRDGKLYFRVHSFVHAVGMRRYAPTEEEVVTWMLADLGQ
jgi:hypothetical protein